MRTIKDFREIRKSGGATLDLYRELFSLWVAANESGGMTFGEGAAFCTECRNWVNLLGREECTDIQCQILGIPT
jgi:hypothetical protein